MKNRDLQSWLIDIVLLIFFIFVQLRKAPGFVYVMYDSATKLTKIGYSNNPQARLTNLKADIPTIKLVKDYQFGNERSARNFEKKMHKKFAKYRKVHPTNCAGRTEFFSVKPEKITLTIEGLLK